MMSNRREIILINRPEAKELDKWGKIERLSRILSVAAIPVVLGIGGWIVQNQLQNQTAIVQQQLQNQTVSKDYVQLAVSILREPDQSKVRPELRGWAVDLLNAYSTVKLNEEIAKQLKSGQVVLPPLETFTGVPSAALSPELDNALKPALEAFQQYLSESGFQIASGGNVKYQVVKGDAIKTESGEFYSFYDAEKGVLMVASDHLGDFDLIRRDYMRHVLDPNYPGPRDPSKDYRWLSYYSVGSGLATYFPCSFSGDPLFAAGDEKIEVNLKNKTRFKNRPQDATAAEGVGEVWAGAFWELREKMGKAAADKLLSTAWISWEPSNPRSDLFVGFVGKLVEIDRLQAGGQAVASIQDIFRRRGLRL